jgi:hypothetical protein
MRLQILLTPNKLTLECLTSHHFLLVLVRLLPPLFNLLLYLRLIHHIKRRDPTIRASAFLKLSNMEPAHDMAAVGADHALDGEFEADDALVVGVGLVGKRFE